MAIETTGRTGSVAVLSGVDVLRQANLDRNQRSAATLTPQIDSVLRWCRETKQLPHFISVADGPGSFTGLRIAVTAAKTLSYALHLPLVAVDSLAAVAAATLEQHPDAQAIRVVTNAYRGQIFSGLYRRSELLPPLDSVPECFLDQMRASTEVVDIDSGRTTWLDSASDVPLGGDLIPNIEATKARLARNCDAVGVGLIAIRAAAHPNGFSNPLALIPRYLKPSAAEEKASAQSAP